MITFRQKGDWSKTRNFLRQAVLNKELAVLEKYGEKGVKALTSMTPIDTGLTASSWYYKIVQNENGQIALQFCNSNIKDHVPIAVIIQYGHATKSGTWVEGQDYINPAIQPIFDQIANEVWKEVTK